MTTTTATLLADAMIDAVCSVARETDAAILTPRYTTEALEFMGWERSKGARKLYRSAYTTAFVRAWEARFTRLGGTS